MGYPIQGNSSQLNPPNMSAQDTGQGQKFFENLPEELIIEILKNLGWPDLNRVSLTSKKLRRISQDYQVLMNLFSETLKNQRIPNQYNPVNHNPIDNADSEPWEWEPSNTGTDVLANYTMAMALFREVYADAEDRWYSTQEMCEKLCEFRTFMAWRLSSKWTSAVKRFFFHVVKLEDCVELFKNGAMLERATMNEAHHAIIEGVLLTMLETPEGRRALTNTNDNGEGVLHLAIRRRIDSEVIFKLINVMLETPEGRRVLTNTNGNGEGILHLAIRRHIDSEVIFSLINVMLKTPEGYRVLTNFNPLLNSFSVKPNESLKSTILIFALQHHANKNVVLQLIKIMRNLPEDCHSLKHIGCRGIITLYLALYYKANDEVVSALIDSILETEEGLFDLALHTPPDNVSPYFILERIGGWSTQFTNLVFDMKITVLDLALARGTGEGNILRLIAAMQKTDEGRKALAHTNETGKTALYFSLKHGSEKVSLALIEAMQETMEGRRALAHIHPNRKTVMYTALEIHASERVKLALIEAMKQTDEGQKALACPNKKDGETVLHYAFGKGHASDKVKLALIEAMKQTDEGLKALACPNKKDGETVLHYAFGKGHASDKVKLALIKAMKQTDEGLKALACADKNSLTALHIAIQKEASDKVVLALIEAMQKTDEGLKALVCANKNSKTALHPAMQKRTTDKIALALIKAIQETVANNEPPQFPIIVPNDPPAYRRSKVPGVVPFWSEELRSCGKRKWANG